MDDDARAVVLAAREAMVNAAKHSGATQVDVYAETTERGTDVFVRDRGAGFVVDQVADDRHGVRDSILARMDRHGGEAPPPLPEAVVTATRERYLQAYERLTGNPFAA